MQAGRILDVLPNGELLDEPELLGQNGDLVPAAVGEAGRRIAEPGDRPGVGTLPARERRSGVSVFPEPDRPINPTIRPGSSRSDTSSRA